MIILLIILFLFAGPIIIGYSAIAQSKLSRKEKWAEARKILLFTAYVAVLVTLIEIIPKSYEFWVYILGPIVPGLYVNYTTKKKKNEEIEPETRE